MSQAVDVTDSTWETTVLQSDVPVLVMTGEFDPITPPVWGSHAAQTLPNSFVFEFPGIGHGASVVPGCPQAMMVDFWEDHQTAPDDSCIQKMLK